MRTPWRAGRAGRGAVVFAVTFLVLVATGMAGMHRLPSLARYRAEVVAVSRPDPSWDVVLHGGGGHLDHTILWNAIGPAIENARRADVLFVGSSLMQFALPPNALRKFRRRTGVAAFSLALPFGEGYRFPLALIEKFDLRPRIVVANAFWFFKEDASPQAVRVRGEDRWAGVRTVWEAHLGTLLWPSASRVFPVFAARRPNRVLLRSSEDGSWMPVRWQVHAHAPVSTRPAPLAWDVRAAQRFRNALAARGIQLVLTCVPSFNMSCAPGSLFAMRMGLGVQALVPRVDAPLWTFDMVHLCPLSGKRFGRALLRELARLDTVRTLARARRPVKTTGL
jgi:hypothetical protein